LCKVIIALAGKLEVEFSGDKHWNKDAYSIHNYLAFRLP
jgi:hypothetical protein